MTAQIRSCSKKIAFILLLIAGIILSSNKTTAKAQVNSDIGSLLLGHHESIRLMEASTDGRKLLSLSSDGTLIIWDILKQTALWSLKDTHEVHIETASFQSDGDDLLAVESFNGSEGDKRKSYNLARYTIKTGKKESSQKLAVASLGNDAQMNLASKKIISFIPGFSASTGNIEIASFNKDQERSKVYLSNTKPRAIALDLKGRHAAIGFEEGNAVWIDMQNGKIVSSFPPRYEGISSLTISPDGQRLLTSYRNGSVCLWDIELGEFLKEWKRHDSSVTAVSFSPDGRFLASGDINGYAVVWEKETDHIVSTFHDTTGVTSLCFTPDSKKIFYGSACGGITLQQLNSQKTLSYFGTNTGEVECVAFSPDGQMILAGYDSRNAILWDAKTGKIFRQFTGDLRSTHSVAFSPSGKLIATGHLGWTKPGKARIWDVSSGQLKQIFHYRKSLGNVKAVHFGRDGKTLLVNECLWNWEGDIDRQLLCNVTDFFDTTKTKKERKLPSRWISTSCFTPDYTHALIGGEYLSNNCGFLTLVNLNNCKTTPILDEPENSGLFVKRVYKAQFLPNNKQILVLSEGRFACWDLKTKKMIREYQLLRSAFSCSPDGRHIAVGFIDSTAAIMDMKTGKVIQKLLGHDYTVTCVSFSPDGKQLVTGSEDKTLILWDLASGKQVYRYYGNAERKKVSGKAPG